MGFGPRPERGRHVCVRLRYTAIAHFLARDAGRTAHVFAAIAVSPPHCVPRHAPTMRFTYRSQRHMQHRTHVPASSPPHTATSPSGPAAYTSTASLSGPLPDHHGIPTPPAAVPAAHESAGTPCMVARRFTCGRRRRPTGRPRWGGCLWWRRAPLRCRPSHDRWGSPPRSQHAALAAPADSRGSSGCWPAATQASLRRPPARPRQAPREAACKAGAGRPPPHRPRCPPQLVAPRPSAFPRASDTRPGRAVRGAPPRARVRARKVRAAAQRAGASLSRRRRTRVSLCRRKWQKTDR